VIRSTGRAVWKSPRGTRRRLTAGGVLAAALVISACAPRPRVQAPQGNAAVDLSQLWEEPKDLGARDLFHGPGGASLMPTETTPFGFVREDRTGYSGGFDVRGPDGMMWSVKVGLEAQPEVAVSRILWAIGYHQPPTYYLQRWTMNGGPPASPAAGRFRPDLPQQKPVGEWSWYENPFVGTVPFKGLVTASVLLGNWDWKASNNRIYELNAPGSSSPRRVYVVRDLGASLGKISFPLLLRWMPVRALAQGSRNDLEGFEEQGFIERVEGDRVDFHYLGTHQSLVKTVTRHDVVWICEQMSRLSDSQWSDAFRAAGYPPDRIARYVTKIKAKIAEGLALRGNV
jgi:hypothetical protein